MGTLHMKFLARQMLEATGAANDTFALLPIVGRRIATLRDLLLQLIDLAFILHIELNRSIVVEKQQQHHKRPDHDNREMRFAPHPEISLFDIPAHF